MLALPMADAWALSLGRIAVQSALGQPLKAEIDIPAITPDEASSLTAVVAPLSAFKSAGMDYNAVLSGVRIQLQPRGDGRAVLHLTSDRVINDPFVDLIIEANWASGRIVRDYTLLFDPPEIARNAPPPAPSQPVPLAAPTVAPLPPAAVTPIFYPPPPSAFRPSPANAGPAQLSPDRREEARRATAELAANIQSQAAPLPPGRGPVPAAPRSSTTADNTPSRFSPAQLAAARAAVASQTAAAPSPRQPEPTPAAVAVAPPAPGTPYFYPPPPSAFRPSPVNSGPAQLSPERLAEASRATSELATNIQSQVGRPVRIDNASPGTPYFYPPPPSAFRPSPVNSGPAQLSPERLAEASRATSELAANIQSQVGRPVQLDNTSRAADTPAGRQVMVRPGDSAARIAAANKPANISLDQMLVALQRQNPDAFVGNNVNRLRAGAVLTLPTAEQAGAVPPQEASRTVVAQSRDFNTFRRRLAEGVPAARVDAASREARGKLQGQVAEPKASTATPDKLTLSKGTGATEDKLASSRQAQDASNRVAELSKNLGDLARLKSGSSALAGGAAAASAAGAGIPVAATAAAPAGQASAPAAGASSAAQVAAATALAVPAPTAASAPAKPKPTAAPILAREEPGFFDDLLDNPLLLPLGGGLLLALLGFGIFRMRQNRQVAQSSLAYPDSRLTADSLTGGNGKMRDPMSSMGYSPSQLDAAGDVDPVEEADVYLAYGRDQQAEEILKEALQRGPARLAVHAKLLEIYAKRRDVQAFDQQAAEAFHVSKGQGSEWARIRALGQELNPANSLYRAESTSTAAALAAALAPVAAEPPVHFGQPVVTVPGTAVAAPLPPAPGAALDFDLDFSADDAGKPATAPAGGTARKEPTLFGEAAPAVPTPTLLDSLPPAGLAPSSDLPDLVFDAPPVAPPRRPEPPAAAPVITMAPAAVGPASDMIEFDLGSLSLEPLAPALTAQPGGGASPDHPLEIKLELAVEFMAIGDDEGARALVEEVLPQATGAIKARAQQMLADLRR